MRSCVVPQATEHLLPHHLAEAGEPWTANSAFAGFEGGRVSVPSVCLKHNVLASWPGKSCLCCFQWQIWILLGVKEVQYPGVSFRETR